MKRSHFSASQAFFGLLLLTSISTSQSALATTLHVPADYATIQAAIDAAVVGDIVEVACGTYQVPEIIMKSGITLRSTTGEADCVIVEPMDPYEGPGDLIQGELDTATVIEGFTFQFGHSYEGGCVLFDGSPRIKKCRFTQNRGRPAPRVYGAESSFGVSDCSTWGAPIIFTNSGALITDCEFVENGSGSGAVAACGSPRFERCVFVANYAFSGGGAASTNGATFVDCMFSDNRSYFDAGAVTAGGTVFERCTFRENRAGINAGAVSASTSTFTECFFDRNSVGDLGYAIDVGGGAIYAGSGTVVIDQCTFWGNNASTPRLGLSASSAAYVAHGSVLVASWRATVVIRGSLANANSGSEVIYCDPGAIIDVECSNIFGNPQGDWTGCIADQLGVNGNISVDPMFCDASNGDFHLSSLSPCLYAECGVMGAFGQGCFDEKPALYQVKDVGNDQGRNVRVAWQRSEHDSPTANPYVTGYGVYRKRDEFAKDAPLPQGARGEGVAILGWDYLGTVPSRGDSVYETVVPTLCDSTLTNGQCLSTFFVSAMTSNPFVYYDSPIKSGYSLDNLAPPTPTGLSIAYNTGSGNELEWDAIVAGDFAGFKIYRSTQPAGFVTHGEYVATTTQTSWTDPDYDGWNVSYGVTSFDMAGNESAPATGGTTTAVPSLAPQQLELLPNVPNPFNPTTRVRFATAAEGPVRIAIYDARGTLIRVLVDKTFPSGHHSAVWDGRDGKGSPVSSGVYLCRLEQRSEFRTRKIVLIK